MSSTKKNRKVQLLSTSRRPRTLRGRGDYSTEVLSLTDPAKRFEAKIDHLERSLAKMAPSSNLAGKVGRSLGNFVGQGDLGSLAGEGLAKLFGFGDYSVKVNSVMHQLDPSGPQPPKFSTDKRSIRIAEREFLGDISSGSVSSGASLFTGQNFPINPLNRTTFPWLSNIAAQFDQWRPNGIVFEFVSSSSEFNGTSQALGTVILATDYDTQDALYTSKLVMENADFSCSTRPSNNLMHGIECDPRERPTEVLYTTVRTANPQLSTLGNFQVATVGCSTAGSKLGELWVSYDIEFYKKTLAGPTSTLLFLQFATPAFPFTIIPGSNLISDFSNNPTFTTRNGAFQGTAGTILFPPDLGAGTFLWCYRIVSTSTTETYNIGFLNNCSIVSQQVSVNNGNNVTAWAVIRINNPNASFGTVVTKATASGTVDWLLTEIPAGITV